MSTWTWTVETPEPLREPARADVAIVRALEQELGQWSGATVQCSRSQIQRLMDEGQVTADGARLRARDPLAPGARVEVHFPPPRPAGVTPEDIPLDILYQDEHVVVINKATGISVHPSETEATGTLVHALLYHVRDLSGVGGVERPGIVHRIDKNTSGVLVVAKSDEAHRKLADEFAKHTIERAYWALCYGAPAQAAGRIESLIGRNPSDRKKMSMDVREGRRAVTHYTVVQEYALARAKPFASLIEARLETGRTHQVRVHLTGLGHSLLGDPMYGTPSDKHTKWVTLPHTVRELVAQLPGQALHARVLGFDHPITGQKLRFEAPAPPAFEALRAHLSSVSL